MLALFSFESTKLGRIMCLAVIGAVGIGVVGIGGPVSANPPDENGNHQHGGGGAPAIAAIKAQAARNGRQNFKRSLVVMDADGSNEVVVLTERGIFLRSGKWLLATHWAPDAQSLAFSLIDFDDSGASGIWTVGIDGSNLFQVTYLGDSPAWSPDGGEIAYSKGGDIWIVNVDGTNDSNLTSTPDVGEWSPTWSPDGHFLAYSADGEVLIHELATDVISNVTGGGPLGGLLLASPDWAKTQDKIVLVARVAGTNNSNDVWVVDLNDPANPVKLTDTPLDEFDSSERFPSWSSDDSQIVFTRERDMYTMNADGSGETLIAAGELTTKWSIFYRSPNWKR